MIDTRKREQIEFKIEQAFRDYNNATSDMTDIAQTLVTLAMREQPVPAELKQRLEECNSTVDFAKQQLAEAKAEYIALIERIRFYPY